MDKQTLLFLLSGGHLKMPERIALGAWPHPPLPFENVAEFLTAELQQNDRWFPYRWEPHESGQLVREGGTIERQSACRYVYRASASHPGAPWVLHEFAETVFSNAWDAAIHYLKWGLHLPGDLDGWTVQ